MRILVYEFASGGGLGGRPVHASLSREGAAMRNALIRDLCAIGGHEVTTTTDSRSRTDVPRGVETATLPAGDRARAEALDRLIRRVDAVWVIAPETARCLERLAAAVTRRGRTLLGVGAEGVRRASDKAALPRLCAALGLRHPMTRAIARGGDPAYLADEVGYPVVVKPARGAGSEGASLVRRARDLQRAVDTAARVGGGSRVLLQEYVRGHAASVSLLASGSHVVALALNAQAVSRARLAYSGGATPFEHPLAPQAIAAALTVCRALPGLRGFVGVDLVLTDSDAVVIEVNPRLTTAYLGLRASTDANIAALALSACAGRVPPAPRAQRRVRFTSAGSIVHCES